MLDTAAFVLASASPRRRELLALTGFSFRVHPTHTGEQRHQGEAPADYARRLSVEKAQAAARSLNEPVLILAADTIVVDGDEVLEKPLDDQDAERILKQLSGRSHHVCTGVTLLDVMRTDRYMTFLACSPVEMRPYTDQEIAAYIATGDPFDKAGAYAIQHPDFAPAQNFTHCFANVMGLPLCHIARGLRMLGFPPPADVPAACRQALDFRCTVYEAILAGGG